MTRDEIIAVITRTMDELASGDASYSNTFAVPVADALCERMMEELEKPKKRRKRDEKAAREHWATLSPAMRSALIDSDWTTTGRRHPRTSHETADGVLEMTGKQRRRVYNYIVGRLAEGAIDDEICDDLGLEGSSVRPRRVELDELGAIMRTGKTRKNKRGNRCNIWVATP